ncbi:uncharacterized protein LOC110267235 isoform X1 [Arachis ipaensis]|uniref:Secreted protein n=1 Tax=Arachis hypogaea TaxID=3818 RepID=A0A6B9VDT6_ARAHY|nr:uncharacterized protein LOC110267235 isoform X1 [Arachis ipaensis]XP_025676926.1 uncharacterized protein LOC112776867 isoform X1 [Arachis hypogaea]QHN78277.1 uncharacterized protein DS421_19g659990 [Arachis hypogaea]QHN78278.1 uncharacterized protein DS421_19g659990 [Arachis hypogaea]
MLASTAITILLTIVVSPSSGRPSTIPFAIASNPSTHLPTFVHRFAWSSSAVGRLLARSSSVICRLLVTSIIAPSPPYSAYNSDRSVTGTISQECGGHYIPERIDKLRLRILSVAANRQVEDERFLLLMRWTSLRLKILSLIVSENGTEG